MVRLGPPPLDDWTATYFDGLDAQLREFWMQSLYDQIYWIPRNKRSGCRWRMNLETFNYIRRLTGPTGRYLVELPRLFAEPEVLLGFPIDLDEQAIGATLELTEVSAA